MKPISNLLLLLGGYDPRLVSKTPIHFQIRYYCFGLAIIVTCIAAFFGALHTGMVYFNNILAALLLAVLWTLIIGIIEHLIVVLTGDHNKKIVGTIRVLASVVFSIIISTPIVLVLCEGPVLKKIEDQTSNEINDLKSEFESRKNKVQQGVITTEKEYLQTIENATTEAGGRGITRKGGEGPITKRLDSTAALLGQQLAEKKASYAKENQRLERALSEEINDIRSRTQKDELTQFRVLLELVREDGAIRFRFITLWLALLFIELLPLTLKLTTPKSNRSSYEAEVVVMETCNEKKTMQAEHELFQQRAKLMLERNNDRIAAMIEMSNSLNYIKDPAMKRKLMQQLEFFEPSEQKIPGQPLHDVVPETANTIKGFPKGYNVLISDHISNKSPFLLSSAIANHAINLCKEASSDQERIEILFRFLSHHVTYDYQHETFLWGYRNAMESYIDKKAICGESSFLFIALARVVGLKADFVLVDADHNDIPVHHACALVCNQLVDIAYNMINAEHKIIAVLQDKQIEDRFKSWRIMDPSEES